MRIVKQRLLEMIPDLSVFLDVDGVLMWLSTHANGPLTLSTVLCRS